MVKMQWVDSPTIFDQHGFTVKQTPVRESVWSGVFVESDKNSLFTRFTIYAGTELVAIAIVHSSNAPKVLGNSRISSWFRRCPTCHLVNHVDWKTFQTGDGSLPGIDDPPPYSLLPEDPTSRIPVKESQQDTITFNTDKIPSPAGIRRLHIKVRDSNNFGGPNFGMLISLPISESATSKVLGPCSSYQPPVRPEVIFTGKWERLPGPPSTPHLERRRGSILDWVKAKVNWMAGSKEPGKKEPGEKEPGEKEPGEKEPGEKDLGPTVPAVREKYLSHEGVKAEGHSPSSAAPTRGTLNSLEAQKKQEEQEELQQYLDSDWMFMMD
ncbi:hypothetical protein QBC39DRAFT_415241 [Podospora conica]|nr:hypothetical protein QBC39DRAFT_415241 [Schizothecium conicum]